MSSPSPTAADDRDATKSNGLRTGAQYLDQIRGDGRQIIYDGELVSDVTAHPAFQGAARSLANLWEIAAGSATICRLP